MDTTVQSPVNQVSKSDEIAEDISSSDAVRLTREEQEELAAEENRQPFIPTVDDDIPDPEQPQEMSLSEAAFTDSVRTASIPESITSGNEKQSVVVSAEQQGDSNESKIDDGVLEQDSETISTNASASDDIFGPDGGYPDSSQENHVDENNDPEITSAGSMPRRSQPMGTMETLAAGAGAAAGLPFSMATGLGSAVRNLMSSNSEMRQMKVQAAAEKNYQGKVQRMVNAYAGVDDAITRLSSTEAAQVRDQYSKSGEIPPDSLMKRLSKDRLYQSAVKDLNKNLRSIERFGTEASKSARIAQIDPAGLNEILEAKNQKLELSAEKLKGLIDEKGRSLTAAVKRMGEKITLLVGALLGKVAPKPEMQ